MAVFKHPFGEFTSSTCDTDSLLFLLQRDGSTSNRSLIDILKVVILKIDEIERRQTLSAISVRPVKRKKTEERSDS